MTELLYTFAKITAVNNGTVELSTGQSLQLIVKLPLITCQLASTTGLLGMLATNQIKLSFELTSTGDEINLAYENLSSWSDKAVKALDELETADRMIVLRCAGMAFSGSSMYWIYSFYGWIYHGMGTAFCNYFRSCGSCYRLCYVHSV